MRPAVGPGRRPTGSTPIRRTPFPFCGKPRKTRHGVGAIATPPMSGSEQVKTVIEWQQGALNRHSQKMAQAILGSEGGNPRTFHV